MSLTKYKDTGLVDNTVKPDTTVLNGKSIVITGGASGFGEAYVRTFSNAGAFVTFCDTNEERGTNLVDELGSNVQFVKCDVTAWDDQLRLFKEAVARSPTNSIDIVIANAGIAGEDDLLELGDGASEPTKPKLRILEVDLIGALYTMKLGVHYFRAQPESDSRDRCIVFKGSLAGYLDLPGYYQYATSKFGLRGLIRSARHTLWRYGIRVNYVAPWYTKTPIMSRSVVERLESYEVGFAEVDDCVKAMLRIITDKTINGRSFATLPRSIDPQGYRDIGLDDFGEHEIWHSLQNTTTAAPNASAPTTV